MFSECASKEYWDWLNSQTIEKVGYTKVDFIDLARSLPYFVHIVIKDTKGKDKKIITTIRLGDAAKGDIPDIKPYKKFKGKTVREMTEAVK